MPASIAWSLSCSHIMRITALSMPLSLVPTPVHSTVHGDIDIARSAGPVGTPATRGRDGLYRKTKPLDAICECACHAMLSSSLQYPNRYVITNTSHEVRSTSAICSGHHPILNYLSFETHRDSSLTTTTTASDVRLLLLKV